MSMIDVGVLIVDPNERLQNLLQQIGSSAKHIKVHLAASTRAMQKLLKQESIDIVLVNDREPKVVNGAAEKLVKQCPETSIKSLVCAVQEILESDGRDYVIKGEISEVILPFVLKKYADHKTSKNNYQAQIHVYHITEMSMPGLIGKSPQMQALAGMIWRVSQSDRPVLITGPSGSGKELVANAIHRLGAKSDGRFLDINCGAIPETLIESQLFGYERGAYTGAERRHDGYFHFASHGTLFLDEIAELPLLMQSKLLRVLENGTFRRVGCNEDCKFTGRIIAATHVDLEERVRHKTFREDLFFRLNVLVLKVPPLHLRRSDIPDLVAHFARSQPRALVFTEQAMRLLVNREWLGNVRELRNLIDRIAVLSDDDPITEQTISAMSFSQAASVTEKLDHYACSILTLDVEDKLTAIQNAMVSRALEASAGNKSAAARLLGVHRKVIERRLSGADLLMPELFDGSTLCAWQGSEVVDFRR